MDPTASTFWTPTTLAVAGLLGAVTLGAAAFILTAPAKRRRKRRKKQRALPSVLVTQPMLPAPPPR